MANQPSRILELRADATFGVQAVEIVPEDNLVEITGRNGQGKSSVLQAIMVALAGAPGADVEVVHDGEEVARVRLVLGDEHGNAVMIVERLTFPDGSTKLKVSTPEGAVFSSPQTMLNAMLATIAFDPLAFSKMKGAQQGAALRKLAGVDFTVIDAQIAAAEKQRRDLNVAASTAEAAETEAKKLAPEAAVEPVVLETTLKELRTAEQILSEWDAAKRNVTRLTEQRDATRVQIQELERKLADARQALATADATLEEAEAKLGERPADTREAIQQRLNTANETNRRAERWAAFDRASKAAKAKRAEHAAADKVVTDLREQKARMLREAKLPVPGLTIDEADIVRFDGHRLDTGTNTAAQLLVSCAVVAAMRPKLRVVLIDQGQALDDENTAAVRAWAIENDFQVWMAVVTRGDDRSFVIEDGRVRGQSLEPIEPPTRRKAKDKPQAEQGGLL